MSGGWEYAGAACLSGGTGSLCKSYDPLYPDCRNPFSRKKNYQELDGNEHYQSWIDSGGLLPFPGGESREEFKRRNVTGFQKAVNGCLRNGISLAALVVHGGTIMNVMEEYADEDRSFYDWHVQNGKGYEVEIDPELWKKGRKFLHVIREL